jgi:U32 family peptidase
MPEITKKPEILAPAGSLEAFFAAMENGADAVYAGLREFSARAKAKNFPLQQMERITSYAHSLDRKVYVTLNTLVKEGELPLLVETLAALAEMRTDGVILQDPGVYRLIREHFPSIPLHASTQMTIHNSEGAKQLEEMGFSRIVLARELHLDDIREIARSTSAEIECFIHGALCFSFSGQCYFSSFLGGHSGNRGRCAQPCRRLYRHRGREGYYFSTNDFSSIDLIPELTEAGVASFKIEGRMKPAEYVANVVAAYRMVVDASAAGRKEAVGKAKELLKSSFGRVPTKGFLVSRTPTDIATPSLKGATGRFLGEIRRSAGGRITFETRDRLHVGDRIRVQPKNDRPGKGFTIRELFIGKDAVKSVREKSLVTTPCPFPFGVGDTVFKVSSETAFTMSENACLRKLETVKHDRVPVSLEATWRDGTMVVAGRAAGASFEREFPMGEPEPARTEDMEGVLAAQFSRTGDTPFLLEAFSAPGFPRVAIPPAKLKEVRRTFYAKMERTLFTARREGISAAKRRALAELAREGSTPHLREENVVTGERPDDVNLLTVDGVDSLVLPISRRNMHGLPALARRLRGREERLVWHLPFIIFQEELPFFREAIGAIRAAGFRRFEASNLSHFPLLRGLDVEIACDYRLFSLNSEALKVWEELGASAATLYLEDDRENMARLLRSSVPLRRRVLLYAGVPAITSRIAIKEVKGEPVVSDRGDGYAVEVKDGLTVVTPTRFFSITGYRGELRGLGCSTFAADLSQVPPEHRKPVLEAFLRGAQIPGTSEFNFTMGLV